MTVTSLDVAPGREHGEASAGNGVIESARYTAAALAGALDSGGGDLDLAAILLEGTEEDPGLLTAMVLLLADCADSAKVTQCCGVNPGLAAANAKRMAEARHKQAEYAWLRDGGVCPETAAQRCGIGGAGSRSEAETAYQTGSKRQRRGAAA